MNQLLQGSVSVTSKAVSSGVVGGLASRFVLGIEGSYQIAGLNLDSMIVYGLVIGGASAINESTKQFTLPFLGISNPFTTTAQMIVGPSLTGAGSVGLSYFANGMILPSRESAMQGFLLGAVSDVTGSYVAEMVQNYIPQQQ